MLEDTIRVVRVLEYSGPRSHVEKVLSQNAVKGIFYGGTITIREAILGPFPEVVVPYELTGLEKD